MKINKLFISVLVFTLLVSISALSLANYSPQVHDFNGKTITKIFQNDRTPDEGTFLYNSLRNVEKKYNVNIKFDTIPNNQMVDKIMASVLAGDPVGEIVELRYSFFLELAANDALQPIGDVAKDYYEGLPSFLKPIKEATTIKGKTYGFHGRAAPYKQGIMLLWNKDLFEEAGLPDLYTLIDNKEWNWQKMREFAVELTKDNNGDGQTDQWGIGGGVNSMILPWEFAKVNGLEKYAKMIDGRLVFNADDKLIESMDYWRELNHKYNVVYPGGHHAKIDPFLNGEVSMFITSFGTALGRHGEKLSESDLNYGISYLPLGPQGTKYKLPVTKIYAHYIPVGIEENLKNIIDLYSAFLNWDFYQDGKQENLSNVQDKESYKLAQEMMENWKVYKYSSFLAHRPSFNQIYKNNNPAAEVIQSRKAQIQSKLDDLFNNNK